MISIKNKFSFLLSLVLLFSNSISAETVGLCIVATGRYIAFTQELIESGRKYFCPDHKVIYFIFTDAKMDNQEDVIYLEQARWGWPYDTLKRVHTYDRYKEQLMQCDYIYATDADMLFVDTVGSEILSDRVCTMHPALYKVHRSQYTYESSNKNSTAYIAPHEGTMYYAGGFYGGSRDEFIKLNATLKANIDKDLANNGFIAVWHDESHINRYFITNPPTLILNPSYCYSYGHTVGYTPKLVALDKDHQELRK